MQPSRVAELAHLADVPYRFGMPTNPARLAIGALACMAVVTGGCFGPGLHRHARGTVRPSANDAPGEQRFVSPPLFVAVNDDAIVRIVGPTMTCTGTLVGDDLVLTAHHCLVERGEHGEFGKRLVAPAQITVELGGDDFAWGEVNARAIVAPPCGEGGGAGDVAVIVLTRKLVGVPTMSVRLDGPPKVGERVRPVGFGRCALSSGTIHRRERQGGDLRTVSPATFEVVASICPGDSGGPVLDERTNSVVGVVSLSAMDYDERTRAPSVMARVDAYRAVLAHASLIADGIAQNELPPLECVAK